MFQINVHAPFRLCQVVIPGMVQRGLAYPDWARDGSVPYGMCKMALEHNE